MKHLLLTIVLVLFAFAKANSQILINELDVDTPSFDTTEFIELRTPTPFQSLDGYILVLFNGSSSNTTGKGRSYYVEDLDGLVTDFNGLIVLGNTDVIPAVDRVMGTGDRTGVFQNGADGVAIYLGEPEDFPEFTFARNDQTLIDALVYGTNDADATELLNLLGEATQYNEGAANNTNSLQLKSDGTYETKLPTPHSLNDTTEPSYIGLDFFITATGDLNEGDFFSLTFSLTKPAPEDFNLNFTLSNTTFDTNDFTGTTSIFIPAGGTSQQLDFNLINDAIDEGDEFIKVSLSNNLPVGYKRLKDNIRYVVIDDDFRVSNFGTPLNPTFGMVASTQPEGYYKSLNGLASPQLEQAITALIAKTGTVRQHTYADIVTILKDADASPLNSNKVWLLYSETELRDVEYQGETSRTPNWNREHVFPRNRGGFFDIKADEIADGINVWVETSVDSLRHGNSDAHHLRATNSGVNSSRGDKNYAATTTSTQYSGPDGSMGSWHGDVARSAFYMQLRYNGISVVNGDPLPRIGQLGNLATLLDWHRQDPPDDFEMNRNNVIYPWQFNRNPFIDNPELVELIFGNQVGQQFTLSTRSEAINQINVYPNPSKDVLHLNNIQEQTDVRVYDTLGRETLNTSIDGNTAINHNLSAGIYLLVLSNKTGRVTKKIIVN